MSRIKILDEMTTGQIAAGEVIERPVSVVKELVENSLDAGANQIFLDINDGGKAGITVYDNGCGMSQEEVSLAFCRHATSKIFRAQDLYSLTTLGFRGEALPSMAAVSRLVLKSKMPGEIAGHEITIKGGKILSLEPAGSPAGTTVKVTELFYNVPARRKYLKSRRTETGLIVNMLQSICLARPEVRFSVKHNNKLVFKSPGSARLLDAVSAVYGVENASEMLEINANHNDVILTGYVSKPSLTRKSRSYITVIVNGRYVKNKNILNAIDAAFKGFIPSGRYPVAVLLIDVQPGLLDVNIHPAKMEIRIDNSNQINELIRCAIRECLRNGVLIPGYKIRPQGAGQAAVLQLGYEEEKHRDKTKEQIPVSDIEYCQKSLNYSFKESKKFDEQGLKQQTIYPPQVSGAFGSDDSFGSDDNLFLNDDHSFNDENEIINIKTNFPFLQVIGQLPPTYILTAGPEGLYILDQHAAHERILYEEFLNMFQSGHQQTQMLLTPVPLELSYKNLTILQEKLHVFEALGFVLDKFGNDTYVLRGNPAHLTTSDSINRFIDLIDDLSEMKQGEDFNHDLITRLSCIAAVKSGETMSLTAMEAIIEQLSRTLEPYTCPHGRPTLVKITKRELDHMFKR